MSTIELLNQLIENLEGSIKPTEIYNEGWMLKGVMEQIAYGNLKLDDLTFLENATWYSEAYVPTFFSKGLLKEGYTHADAIVGHLQKRKNTKNKDTKWGFEIEQNCSCLYIVEAKMYSKSSKKVANESDYDQCARNVACLMKMIYEGSENKETIKMPEKVGFYVFLPEKQKSVFKEVMNPENIKKTIERRLNSYFDANIIKENYNEKKEKELKWLKENLSNFIDKIDIKMIFWEELIESTKNSEIKNQLNEFYKKCQNPFSK